MNVLVACEESQRVCLAFREKGHNAFSCDITDCSGGHPEYHIKGDVLQILNPWNDGEFDGIDFCTCDGNIHCIDRWDLIIAHPPCTYLTVTGNRWFNVDKYGDKARERISLREKAFDFVMQIANADCEHIVIENPVGYLSTKWRKPDQIIQPYLFGEEIEKKTCLWLKNMPLLKPTKIVSPPPRIRFESGKSMPEWYANLWGQADRAKIRSKTPFGIALAMAEQWG